jgi:diamine N-acetyltransferase
MKRSIAPFGDEYISLRLVKESDLETTLDWRNRDDARVWFKTSSPLTLEQHQAWFHRYLNKDDDFLFVVEAEGKLVGQASVYDIQWDKGHAEIGRFLVAPESGGKGYIGKACEALIRLCADTLSIRYLFLEVLEANDRAIRLYQRNGFEEERRYSGLIRMSRALEPTERA